MKRIVFSLLLVSVFMTVGCKKTHEERPDLSYDCECGELRWNGTEYPLSLAEKVSLADSTFDRSYYITAPIHGEDAEPSMRHHLNMDFSVDDYRDIVFYPDSDTNSVRINIEEVIKEGTLPTVYEYIATTGTININRSIVDGSETVNFNIGCSRLINGQLVGEDVPLSGSFTIGAEL